MKNIMTKLRYYFHLNKQGLQAYLNKYGFRDTEEELSFENYFQFLRVANPNTTYNEAVYIFNKTDIDGNGAISLEQILLMLKNYGVAVEDPRLRSSIAQSQSEQISADMRSEVEGKLISFFKRLRKMIEKNKLSLQRIYNDFDRAKKGYLNYQQFKNMLQKIGKQITEDDAIISFNILDDNHSKTIGYQELNRYYCLVNQIQVSIAQ